VTIKEAFEFLVEHPGYSPYMVLIFAERPRPVLRLCGFVSPSKNNVFSLSEIKLMMQATPQEVLA
jgi:hypothetical protein